MKTRAACAAICLCVLSCLPASARGPVFSLDDAVQDATHVVVMEAEGDGFRVVQSWAGDLAPGAALDCLDLYSANEAQYKRIAAETNPLHSEPSVPEPSPLFANESVFVPEGLRFILFLREIRSESEGPVPTAELLPERTRRFACVSNGAQSVVTSLVWSQGEAVYCFANFTGGPPYWPEELGSPAARDGVQPRPMTPTELKDLVTSRRGAGEPAEQGRQSAAEIEWRTGASRALKACQFREVTLRLYRGGEVIGAEYGAVTGQILGRRVVLPPQTVPDDGVLLCVPDDQTDPIVAEGLSNEVRLCIPTQQVQLGVRDFSLESKQDLLVLDALGDPISGAAVSLSMQRGYGDSVSEQVPLCTRTTDPNGRVRLLALPDGWHCAPLDVAHPDYGLTRIRYNPEAVNAEGKIETSLVRAGSEARKRALRGIVLDSAMKPVRGAVVRSDSVRPHGLLITGEGVAVTDEHGFFCIYLANRQWAGQSDKNADLIPLRSDYGYQVNPPKESGLRSAAGWAENSASVTISLESEEGFAARSSIHTFTFAGGFPEPAGAGAGTQVAVRSDDAQFGVDLTSADEEHRIPHGTYYASIVPGNVEAKAIDFEQVAVNSESPKELAFRMVQFRCAGKVISGVTGEPIPGALCLAGSQSWIPLHLTFDDLSEELRTALTAPGVSKSDLERLAGPLRDDFKLLKAVVTDKEGRYEVLPPPGQAVGLVYAIAEGYVPAGRHVYSANPSVESRLDLDPIPLYPAGEAKMRIAGDDAKGPCRVTWHTDETATAGWAVPLKGYEDRTRHSLEIMVGRLEPGRPDAAFLLPAHAPLRITVYPPNEDLIPVRLAVTVRAKPAKVTDLGEIRFEKAYSIPATFRVVDEQGNPVEGIPVSKFAVDSWSCPCLTDANGVAEFLVEPGVTEKVGIPAADEDIAFVLAPGLDTSAQIQHTFQLSAERLNNLLK